MFLPFRYQVIVNLVWANIRTREEDVWLSEISLGYQIARQLSNLGVDEDEVESYFGETYNRCVEIGTVTVPS